MTRPSTTQRVPAAVLTVVALFFGAAVVLAGQTPAEATTRTRTVVLSTQASTYTDSAVPNGNFAGAAVRRISKSRYATYLSFAPVTLASDEAVAKVSLSLAITSATPRRSTGLVAAPVTGGWIGTALTYRTQPAVGGRLNSPASVKGGTTTTIRLASAARDYVTSSSGLAVRLVHSTAGDTAELAAGRAKLTVTITSTTGYLAANKNVGAPVASPSSTNGRLVFAHYFPPYPLSFYNEVPSRDYYTRNYVTPTPADAGEQANRAWGGLLRDRPIPANPRATSQYVLENLKTEVRQARRAGIDGFAVDILSLDATNDNYLRVLALLQAAAQASPGFQIMLQPDMNSMKNISRDSFVAGMAKLISAGKASGDLYRRGGRVVVSPFNAENKSLDWWKSSLSGLGGTASAVSFLPLFLDFGRYRTSAWDAISDGYADWGGRSPGQTWSFADAAHKSGKVWMQPVAAQDARPKDGSYYEAGNSEALRENWGQAISRNADMVLLVSWNDYSETSSVAPSVQHGYSLLDISSYYLAWFKTGRVPAIAHEAIFLSHRQQAYQAKPSLGYAKLMAWRGATAPANSCGISPRDTVEVLTMLRSSATVQLRIGSTTYTYTAKAGVNARTFPLAVGSVSARFLRSGKVKGTVATPKKVVAQPRVQDLGYLFASSLRMLPRQK